MLYSDARLSKNHDIGCNRCHNGPSVGGGSDQKLGTVKPYETADLGRFQVTGVESDRQVFKVPSLRNVAKTRPWLHDGSIASLDQMMGIMSEHQLGRALSDEQGESITLFFAALTGQADPAYIRKPELPESGPDTPPPDPS